PAGDRSRFCFFQMPGPTGSTKRLGEKPAPCQEHQTKRFQTPNGFRRGGGAERVGQFFVGLVGPVGLVWRVTALRIVSLNSSIPSSKAADIASRGVLRSLRLNFFKFSTAGASSILLATTSRGFSSSAGS